ncbi:MAG TPA: hydantoinase/oxoprolinase family protein [Ramlibacter sp.]|nr:hydantoinase/oxoprolinase family protein [Ramlibacter sp.]
MSLIVAADTGGTFTDLVACDRATGEVSYVKSLTNYSDLVQGFIDCVRKANVDLSKAEVVKFGTTLVINTFVQRNGSKTALVTTQGFRDVLEIGRGNRTIPFDLRFRREPLLVERDLRFEVRERMAADGTPLLALDKEDLQRVAGQLKKLGVESVAVSFLNSYANASHEEQAKTELTRLLPDTFITTGTELSNEWYEFERTSNAVANAYVGPALRDYVSRLATKLKDEGFCKTFFLMASNGGVFSTQRAQQQPVMLVESGPVGGCIGASIYATEMGLNKVIAFDMGGTTAKCALLVDGRFDVKSPYFVGGPEKGFPVRGGVLDIVEVGTGGGSIASLDSSGRLLVGPRSAGSTPGPACYGRGGVAPTITDVNLVLGRIGPKSFLGGSMPLEMDAARTAVRTLADQLGYKGDAGLDELADGVLKIGSFQMAAAVRQITVERGADPREFSLVAFGGGGPLHSVTIARELNIPEVIIPPEPGNFSALGMVLADARVDEVRTFLRKLEADSLADLRVAFTEIQAKLVKELQAELGKQATALFDLQAEMRFRGQRHAVRVSLPKADDVAQIRSVFEDVYERRYGHVDRKAPLEFVNVVVTAYARIDRPPLSMLCPKQSGGKPEPIDRRSVYFGETGSRMDTPVFSRATLPVGFEAGGPAIIEEYGTTTVVGPEDRFRIGDLGEIRISFPNLETRQ